MEKARIKFRHILTVLCALTAFASPACAHDDGDILNPTGETVGAPEGPYDVLSDEPAGLSDEICRYMIYYVPPPGVSYQEGVDAYGNAVTPADDPDTIRIDDPEASFHVNLTLDLADRLGLDLAGGVTPEAMLGVITVDHGRMYFNGQSLQPNALDVMLDECGQGMVNFE